MISQKVLKKLENVQVLIVESEALTAYSLKEYLCDSCQSIYLAKDGMEGFEIFEKKRPDVVIASINLPKLNGFEMISHMREITPSLPVIIISSMNSSRNILRSINQGVYSYLRKPICPDELQLSILMATKDIYNSQLQLANGYSYKKLSKTLLDENNNIVHLTKTERDLLYLLIINKDKIVEYSTIQNYVWKDKTMTSEALRMAIKKIRKKSYSELIRNFSSYGYKINIH